MKSVRGLDFARVRARWETAGPIQSLRTDTTRTRVGDRLSWTNMTEVQYPRGIETEKATSCVR